MKKLLLSMATLALCASASAQYIIVNDELPISANDVEKITYEEDEQFESSLLPGQLASDPKTTIFSQALQLTGLADTLQTYIYDNYIGGGEKYYYRSHVWTEVAWTNKNRFKMFTVFAETDSTFKANGINNLDDLKAYAKQVYDEAYPEDASVSDPTDRRNSLNRFVAYHILGHGSSYWYLTAYDGTSQGAFWLNTSLADMSAWYGTLMPHASLKCSYPMGKDKGLYLNRRGLRNGPDKYGKQIRGAKIVTDGENGFDHMCFNGYYFHIDGLLTYDKKTQNEVLGTELWRVDFKTLSSDIMNNADELRGNYLADDSQVTPDDSPNPKNGRNYRYEWESMENIKGESARNHSGLIARRAHLYFWSWQGDEVQIFDDFDMTIKLPPVPAGEWEVRMGASSIPTRPNVRIYLNGEVTIDSLDMSNGHYYPADWNQNYGAVNITYEYMIEHPYFNIEKLDEPKIFKEEDEFGNVFDSEFWYLVTDIRSGEKMYMEVEPIYRTENNGRYYYRFNATGIDPDTSKPLDWRQRIDQYVLEAEKAANLAMYGTMRSPRECTVGQRQSIFDLDGMVRYPLGRIISDGKSDNYLRIENLPVVKYNGNTTEAQFDYFELVPKFVYENQEIPEE